MNDKKLDILIHCKKKEARCKMLVMTYSDARAHLSELLNQVKRDGAAIIKRADGSTFRVTVVRIDYHLPFRWDKKLCKPS